MPAARFARLWSKRNAAANGTAAMPPPRTAMRRRRQQAPRTESAHRRSRRATVRAHAPRPRTRQHRRGARCRLRPRPAKPAAYAAANARAPRGRSSRRRPCCRSPKRDPPADAHRAMPIDHRPQRPRAGSPSASCAKRTTEGEAGGERSLAEIDAATERISHKGRPSRDVAPTPPGTASRTRTTRSRAATTMRGMNRRSAHRQYRRSGERPRKGTTSAKLFDVPFSATLPGHVQAMGSAQQDFREAARAATVKDKANRTKHPAPCTRNLTRGPRGYVHAGRRDGRDKPRPTDTHDGDLAPAKRHDDRAADPADHAERRTTAPSARACPRGGRRTGTTPPSAQSRHNSWRRPDDKAAPSPARRTTPPDPDCH